MKVLDKIKKCGIVPVVVIEDASKAKALGQAVLEGKLGCMEITFRTKEAVEALKIIKKEYPQMTLGAGTVLTVEQAQKAVDAGAEFIVSPGSNPKVIQYCMDNGICVIPGVMTPSEIEQNLAMGIETMKFFPAEAAGGLKMIKAMSAPYGNVTFMPTGGINSDNVREYLKFQKIIACGGSWMVKGDLIESEKFDEITRMSKEAVDIVKEIRG